MYRVIYKDGELATAVYAMLHPAGEVIVTQPGALAISQSGMVVVAGSKKFIELWHIGEHAHIDFRSA
eukprot:1778905-Prymnesium_polylepis.1